MTPTKELIAHDEAVIRVAVLQKRLHLIERAAFDRIDVESPHSTDWTYWTQIVGLAQGDPNWLQREIDTYEQKHARLVQLCKGLLESTVDSLDRRESCEHIAVCMADQIEEAILPEMVLGEDGRTFLRSQGQPYPRVEAAK